MEQPRNLSEIVRSQDNLEGAFTDRNIGSASVPDQDRLRRKAFCQLKVASPIVWDALGLARLIPRLRMRAGEAGFHVLLDCGQLRRLIGIAGKPARTVGQGAARGHVLGRKRRHVEHGNAERARHHGMAGLVIGLQPLEFAFAVHRMTRFVACNAEMSS